MSMDRPRIFALERQDDPTGISGVGHVADGVRWSDGSASVRWRGANPSVVFWDGFESVEEVHGHGGATRIVWDSRPVVPQDLAEVQSRLEDVLQGDVEGRDRGAFMAAVWASIRDIQPLLAEVGRLRVLSAVVAGFPPVPQSGDRVEVTGGPYVGQAGQVVDISLERDGQAHPRVAAVLLDAFGGAGVRLRHFTDGLLRVVLD